MIHVLPGAFFSAYVVLKKTQTHQTQKTESSSSITRSISWVARVGGNPQLVANVLSFIGVRAVCTLKHYEQFRVRGLVLGVGSSL